MNTKVKLVVLISAILAVVTISSVLTASIVGKKPGRIDTPAYDSGWFSITAGNSITIEHNLGTTEVFVYFIGETEGSIHQGRYGGAKTDQGMVGATWYDLNATHIKVWRYWADDWYPNIRVQIWKIAQP